MSHVWKEIKIKGIVRLYGNGAGKTRLNECIGEMVQD
jgi:hypothetical protein